MRRALLAAAAALALAGAANAQTQWDPVFAAGNIAGGSLPGQQAGLLFGSFALAAPMQEIDRLVLWLRPLGDASREFAIVANNGFHTPKRDPDSESAAEKAWVFSGLLPAGRYEIARAELCKALSAKAFLLGSAGRQQALCFKSNGPQPVLLEVAAGGTVYMGRWQMSLRTLDVPEPKLTWMERHIAVRDTLADDLAVLEKQRQTRPIPPIAGAVTNAVAELVKAAPAAP